jgi:hypothetical protein
VSDREADCGQIDQRRAQREIQQPWAAGALISDESTGIPVEVTDRPCSSVRQKPVNGNQSSDEPLCELSLLFEQELAMPVASEIVGRAGKAKGCFPPEPILIMGREAEATIWV